MAKSELTDLEEAGWRALAASGEASTRFYNRVLDQAVLMLLPGGVVLDDRATIIDSMGGQPWSSYRLEHVREHRVTDDVGVVSYGVVAQRLGAAEYSALVSSTYVRRDDGWKLSFHQQTPR